jgi:hypothetical protein
MMHSLNDFSLNETNTLSNFFTPLIKIFDKQCHLFDLKTNKQIEVKLLVII